MPALRDVVCCRRQAGYANTGVAFVPDVQADQQRCNLLQDASVLQFAAVEGANAGNLCGQVSHDLAGIRVIAANDHITVDRAVGDVDLGARGGMIVGDAW